jgi:hypothetical protein
MEGLLKYKYCKGLNVEFMKIRLVYDKIFTFDDTESKKITLITS